MLWRKSACVWQQHPVMQRVRPLSSIFTVNGRLWFGFRLMVVVGLMTSTSNIHLLNLSLFLSSLPFILFLTRFCPPTSFCIFQSPPHPISDKHTELVYSSHWENRPKILDAVYEIKKEINAKKINWLCKSQDCHAVNWFWMTALCGPWVFFSSCSPVEKIKIFFFF